VQIATSVEQVFCQSLKRKQWCKFYGLASYLELTTFSEKSTTEINPPKGLHTSDLLGQRIAQITKQLKLLRK